MKKTVTKKNDRSGPSNVSTFAQWDQSSITITLLNSDHCTVKDGKETITIDSGSEVDLLDHIDIIKSSYKVDEDWGIGSFNISIPESSQFTDWDGNKNFIIRESITMEPVAKVEYVTIRFWDPGNTEEEGFEPVVDDTFLVDNSKISRTKIFERHLSVNDTCAINYNNTAESAIGMWVGFKQTSDNILIPLPLNEKLGLDKDHIEKFKLDTTKLTTAELDIDLEMMRFDYFVDDSDYTELTLQHIITNKSKEGSPGDLSEVVIGLFPVGMIDMGLDGSDIVTHSFKYVCNGGVVNLDYPTTIYINEKSAKLEQISPDILRYFYYECDPKDEPLPDEINNVQFQFNDKQGVLPENYILPLVPINELYRFDGRYISLSTYYINVDSKRISGDIKSYYELPEDAIIVVGKLPRVTQGNDESITLQIDKIITDKNKAKLKIFNVQGIQRATGYAGEWLYRDIHNVSYGDLNLAEFPNLKQFSAFEGVTISSDTNWSNLKLNSLSDSLSFSHSILDFMPTIPSGQFETNDLILFRIKISDSSKRYFESSAFTIHSKPSSNSSNTTYVPVDLQGSVLVASEKCVPVDFINIVYPDNATPLLKFGDGGLFYEVGFANANEVDVVSDWVEKFLAHITNNKNYKLSHLNSMFRDCNIQKAPESLFDFVDTNISSLYFTFYNSNITRIPSQEKLVEILKGFPNLRSIKNFAASTNITHIPELWLDNELDSRLEDKNAFIACSKADNWYRCPVVYGGPSTIYDFEEIVLLSGIPSAMYEGGDEVSPIIFFDFSNEAYGNQIKLGTEILDTNDIDVTINGTSIMSTHFIRVEFTNDKKLMLVFGEYDFAKTIGEHIIKVSWRDDSKQFTVTVYEHPNPNEGGSSDIAEPARVDWNSLRNANPITNDGIAEFKSYTLNNK